MELDKIRAGITQFPGVVDAAFYDHGSMGKQLVVRFANGFGLSIASEATDFRRYADDSRNEWEVGVTKYYGDDIDNWNLYDDAGYMDGAVLGWQTANDIEALIRQWASE